MNVNFDFSTEIMLNAKDIIQKIQHVHIGSKFVRLCLHGIFWLDIVTTSNIVGDGEVD